LKMCNNNYKVIKIDNYLFCLLHEDTGGEILF